MEAVSYLLGPVSSLLVWRSASFGGVDEPVASDRLPDFERLRARVADLRSFDCVKALGDVPLDVIVGNPKWTHRSKSLDMMVLRKRPPLDTIYRMDAGLYVCSPELCFALLARGGRRLHLIELGCELCGTYAIAPDATGRYDNCPARTTVDAIRATIEGLGQRHGKALALSALSDVKGGSDSPRETSLYIALSQPERYGGYAIRNQVLNGRIDVVWQLDGVRTETTLFGDEVFYDEDGDPCAICEYDSQSKHFRTERALRNGVSVDIEKILADDERRELLRDNGREVITFRLPDTKDFARFDEKAMRLGRLVGQEPTPSEGSLRFRRIELLRSVFDTRRWANEHDLLRVMAGYERGVRHKKEDAR